MKALISVNRPKIKILFQRIIVRLAEQRPDARSGLAFTARDDDKRKRYLPFAVFLAPIVNPGEERPERRRRVALGRTHHAVNQGQSAEFFGIIRADAGGRFQIKRPEREEIVLTTNGFNVAETVGFGRHVFVLAADQRPELPAMQAVTMAQMEKRIEIIIGDDVALLALAVNRKQDEENVVAEQPVVEVAVNRKECGIIFVRIRRALLEIERKKREAPFAGIVRLLTAGKTKKLDELPAIFLAVVFIGQQRVQKIIFPRFDGRVSFV